jgi:hypothetical protein
VLPSTMCILKCFLLLCNVMVIKCLNYEDVEIKEYSVRSFVLFFCTNHVIFLMIVIRLPFLGACIISIASSIFLYLCRVFIMCCA